MRILTFTSHDIDFGVALTDVVCIIDGRINITDFSSAPDYIIGFITLHGTIVPIYSLALQYGYTDKRFRYLVIVSANELKIGIGVDDVSKIIDVERDEIFPTPDCVNSAQNCFHSLISQQWHLIMVMNVNDLMPQKEEKNIRRILKTTTTGEE